MVASVVFPQPPLGFRMTICFRLSLYGAMIIRDSAFDLLIECFFRALQREFFCYLCPMIPPSRAVAKETANAARQRALARYVKALIDEIARRPHLKQVRCNPLFPALLKGGGVS